MPRSARSMYAGEHYHVITRGNNRQKLFHDDEDFRFYLEQLRKYKERCDVSVVHYCIMSNHVHLLARSEKDKRAISKMMHGIGMVYARHHKLKRRRTDHVFEDRFKHIHIESDSYLLECGRYIERNPLRAR
jgi:putative transposase